MKRYALIALALLGVLVASDSLWASGPATYGGYQPWYNIFAKRKYCMSVEEERLQRFWHDYYDALRRYYGALDHVDWVAYYKNHGYQINAGCGGGGGGCGGSQRIQFAPVFVSPTMQWAVPNAALSGAPVGAPCPPSGAYGCGPMGCPPGGGGMPGGYGQAPAYGQGGVMPTAGYGGYNPYAMPANYGYAPQQQQQ